MQYAIELYYDEKTESQLYGGYGSGLQIRDGQQLPNGKKLVQLDFCKK